MHLTPCQLKQLVIEVATEQFGRAMFHRRQLMRAVEERTRQIGVWTLADDKKSKPRGVKSRGLATIDWAISNLKGSGLNRLGHDQWQLP